MKRQFRILTALGLPLLVSACVMYPEPPPPLSVEYGTYSCNGSYQFVAKFQDEGTKVALEMDRGRTRMLERNASGLYSDGTFALQGSQTIPITIFKNGVPIMENCMPVTTQKQYYRKDNKFRPFDIRRDLD